jgi:hypothetical protein
MVLRDAVRSLFDGARRLHARLHHRQLNQSRPVARDLLALRCIGRRRLLERHRDSSRVSELAPRYWNYATFEPTFLYETCWNLLLFAALTWLWRTRRVRAPGLFWLYVAGYSGFRVFEETQWIDYSNYFLGMRVNFWIRLAAVPARAHLLRARAAALPGMGPPGRRTGAARDPIRAHPPQAHDHQRALNAPRRRAPRRLPRQARRPPLRSAGSRHHRPASGDAESAAR